MASNFGKYIDRSPNIRPAGQVATKQEEKVVSCLTHEVSEDEDVSFVCKREQLDYEPPTKRIHFYKGYFSSVRECLQPETDLGHFDVLKKEFNDTVYDSYWKKEVGRVPDPSPMLPAGMDPMKVRFGKATPALSLAGEIINPPKLYVDVISEPQEIHEMYKRTHNDYYPGEQINRNYVGPFNREFVYGKHTPSDPHGGCIKKVLYTEAYKKILVSKILADYKNRVTSFLGKVHAPNNNINRVPNGHAFGILNKRDIFGTGELLKDSNPNLEKFYLHQEISHVNILRNQIAKKQPPFPHRDFIQQLHNLGFKNTGLICLQEAYDVLRDYEIFPEPSKFEALLKRLGILTSEKLVFYEKLADLLNVNVEFPEIKKINDIPSKFLFFETTNQEAHRYHNDTDAIKNTKAVPIAGVPLQKNMSINSLISPANYSQYFLEAKDFFISRAPEYFKDLLNGMGCEISLEKFNNVWNAAQENNGCVSVNSFIRAMKNCL